MTTASPDLDAAGARSERSGNVAIVELSDWTSRWTEGRIGFHQAAYTSFLENYAQQAWGRRINRVFVPLCGKSLDLIYLAERAQEVVGVEYVQQAVEEFFTERNVTPEIESGLPTRYQADKYTIFAGDFFELTTDQLGPIDAVFDRASLVALPLDTRPRYAEHMATIVPSGAVTLLITFDYDQSQMDGPPFAVSTDEVQHLYQADFNVELLETRDVLDDGFRQRGLSQMTETAYLLTRH